MFSSLFKNIHDKFNDKWCEKHHKYRGHYQPNVMYWGLGIENEVYLELSNPCTVSKTDIIHKQRRERYSVDYSKNYKPEYIKRALEKYVSNIDGNTMCVPLLINANSFTKTDIYNQPARLYTKECEENPRFSGETMIETLQKKNVYFTNTIDNEWVFDGDTVEFNTLGFFNTTLDDVVDELETSKTDFIRELNNTLTGIDNSCYDNQSVSIMKKNYAFAKYMTNLGNVAMYNNGTLHYNITLPTQLDSRGKISDWPQFIKDHRKAIRAIQWMEPFIIAAYCSPDPFSYLEGEGEESSREEGIFSKASQRLAVSRYIGVGTYNADTMEIGKVLTKPIPEIICSKIEEWWYPKFIAKNAYGKLDNLGMDINFNKHYNHGIELRFLDHICDVSLVKESFEFIVYLMDFVLESDNVNYYGNPILTPIWNNIVLNVMIHGRDYRLTQPERGLYEEIFLCKFSGNTVNEIYGELFAAFNERYHNGGLFSKLALRHNTTPPPTVTPSLPSTKIIDVSPIVKIEPIEKKPQNPCCIVM